MQKQRIEYASPVDAIVAVAKRLSVYETRYQMSTEDFFDKFTKGQVDDGLGFVEWANDYRHFSQFVLLKLRRYVHPDFSVAEYSSDYYIVWQW